MSEAEPQHVTCPTCDASYRWQDALAGRTVPCKKCGKEFIVPAAPGKGQPLEPEPKQDEPADDIYELAEDLDDEPTPPPPPRPMPPPPPAAVKPAVDPNASGSSSSSTTDDALPEEPKHVSEAVRAARREEQRIAAAAAEPVRSWRDYKLQIILVALAIIVGLIIFAMYGLSDVLNSFMGD